MTTNIDLYAALAEAQAQGLPLIIPPGVHYLATPLTVAGNVTIEGDGATLQATGTDCAVDLLGGGTLRMRGVTIAAGAAPTALRLTGVLNTDSVIDSVKLLGGAHACLDVGVAAGATSTQWRAITLGGGKFGIYAPDAAKFQNTKFFGMRASNIGADGSGAVIYARNAGTGQPSLDLFGCTIEGNRGPAIDWRGGGNINIFGGHQEKNCRDTERGEFHIGGAYEGKTVACYLRCYGVRFGHPYAGNTAPRIRRASTHTTIVVADCAMGSGYRVALDVGTAAGSNVYLRGMPGLVVDGAEGSRVYRDVD